MYQRYKTAVLNFITRTLVEVLFLLSIPELFYFAKRNREISIPPVMTYGDLFLHFYVTSLLMPSKSTWPVFIFDDTMAINVANIFGKKSYFVYSNFFYKIVSNFFRKFKCNNLKKEYETRILKFYYKYSIIPPYDAFPNSLAEEFKSLNYSKDFIQASKYYLKYRSRLALVGSVKEHKISMKFENNSLSDLRERVGVHGRKYCVLHFKFTSANADPRGSSEALEYKGLIDRLWNEGIVPVLMGTPKDYEKIDALSELNVIRYFESEYQSPENDIRLFSEAEFYIGNGTGVSVLAYLTGKPALILDVMPFADWHGFPDHLYYPKPIFDKSQKNISLNELIAASSYFDMSKDSYTKNQFILGSMGSDEILNAFEDFIKRLEKSPLSEDQKLNYMKLSRMLHPLHLGLHNSPNMLCPSYLKKYLA